MFQNHDRVVELPVNPRPESTTNAGTMDDATQPSTLHRRRNIAGPCRQDQEADFSNTLHDENSRPKDSATSRFDERLHRLPMSSSDHWGEKQGQHDAAAHEAIDHETASITPERCSIIHGSFRIMLLACLVLF